jgi:hypothetical protein
MIWEISIQDLYNASIWNQSAKKMVLVGVRNYPNVDQEVTLLEKMDGCSDDWKPHLAS